MYRKRALLYGRSVQFLTARCFSELHPVLYSTMRFTIVTHMAIGYHMHVFLLRAQGLGSCLNSGNAIDWRELCVSIRCVQCVYPTAVCPWFRRTNYSTTKL